MEKSKRRKHYSGLPQHNRRKTASDEYLPGEKEEEQHYNIPPVKYRDREESAEEHPNSEQVLVNFRMSRSRKELLERWFRRERDQNFSAGMRDIINEFMRHHNIL